MELEPLVQGLVLISVVNLGKDNEEMSGAAITYPASDMLEIYVGIGESTIQKGASGTRGQRFESVSHHLYI